MWLFYALAINMSELIFRFSISVKRSRLFNTIKYLSPIIIRPFMLTELSTKTVTYKIFKTKPKYITT